MNLAAECGNDRFLERRPMLAEEEEKKKKILGRHLAAEHDFPSSPVPPTVASGLVTTRNETSREEVC